MEKKVIKNYVYNVLYQLLILIIPLITTPYISRTLGAESIGAHSYTNSIVQYFVLFAGLGMSMYGQREIAYHQTDKKANSKTFFEVTEIKTLTVIVVALVYILAIRLFDNDVYKKLLYIQIINIISVFFDISWFFQGLEDFKKVLIRNFVIKVAGTVFVFAFIHNPGDVYKYALILSLSTALGNLSLWPYLRNNIESVPFLSLSPFKNIKTVLELFAPMIATSVYNVLDKTMIGVITGSDRQNGYYEQTTKIISVILVVVTSLGTVLLPRMSSSYKEGNMSAFKNEVDSAYRYVILISCALCFGIISCSDNLITWFLGEDFTYVSVLVKVYAIVILLIPLSNIAGAAILTPIGEQNKGTLAVTLGAIVNFISNIILIKRYGAYGAAVATVLAEVIVTLLHFYYIRDYIKKKELTVFTIRYLLAASVMSACIYFITPYFKGLGVDRIGLSLVQMLTGAIVYISIALLIYKEKMLKDITGMIKKNGE